MHITDRDARRVLRNFGMTLSKRDNEYRVNFLGAREASAYYTNDVSDALNTGTLMAMRADTAIFQSANLRRFK